VVLKKTGKVKIAICLVLRLLVLLGGILALINRDWESFGLCILTLFTLFLPIIIERKLSIEFPGVFEVLIVVFLFCSIFLGSINSFYDAIWWWDLLLHAVSGLIVAALGFSLADILNRNERLSLSLRPLFLSIFSFSFAMAIGAIWEIYEFAMDSIFGMNMQKSGLVDTMWDLIFDAIGALVFSLVLFIKLKRKGDIVLRLRLKKRETKVKADKEKELPRKTKDSRNLPLYEESTAKADKSYAAK
jgi:hypothetical protein